MLNFLIWLRGIMANNLGVSAVVIWIMVMAVLVGVEVVIVKFEQSKKPLGRGWKTFFVVILLANLLFWNPNGWVALMMTTGVDYYLYSHGLYDWWMPLVCVLWVVSLVATVGGLLMFIWTSKLSKKKMVIMEVLFGWVFIDLMLKIFVMGGLILFSYGQTLWPGVAKTTALNMDVRNIVTLPRDKKELQQFFPEKVREIENYGTLCYFYDEKNDNYLIMTRMAEHFVVYNREFERVVVDESDEKWQEWVEKCR